jgi:hypothetical protein
MLNFLPIEETEPDDEYIPDPPKVSDLTPKEFVLGIAKRIKTENESERAKTNSQFIVQMCRRHRNMTAGDAFGYWKNGVWCESAEYQSLQCVPIFQSLIRGAESNFTNVDIRLDIFANANKYRPVANIATDIYEILDERQWNENARSLAFYSAILMLNAYYISRFDREKGDEIPMPQFAPMKYEQGGTAICSQCYQATDYGAETGACPSCGGELTVVNDPETVQDSVVSGFGSQKTGEAEMVVADGLDVSVDPKGKPCDVHTCGWIEWRVQAQKEELKRLYSHLKLDGKPDWSYQTRLKKALKRYEQGEGSLQTESDKTEHEVRNIWLDVTEYEGYIPPKDLKLGNQVVLKAKVPMSDQYPKGCILGLVGQEIAFLDKENKNKRVKASLWLSDGVAFEGLGAKAGLSFQRKINQLENIAMEGETRSLKGSVIYDPQALNGNHLEGANTNIPLKNDFALGGRPISDYAMPLTIEGLSQSTLAYMEMQKQGMQEVMGVPDVVLGQDTAKDPTYGGQALRNRNALGLLTPATKSTARAREGWLGDQLDIIQEFYSPEALKQFGARHGREWLDDEIDLFFECDLESDLTIRYVPGTEVAESRFEKQMRLRQDITAGFVQMSPELMAQLARESNYDAPDIGNYESNLKLADKRFAYIKKIVETPLPQVYEQYEQMAIDPATGMRLTDPMGVPVVNPFIGQVLAAPEMAIYELEENHAQMAEYWSAKVRDLAGASKAAPPMLLAICTAMVRRHKDIEFQNAMQDSQKLGVADAAGKAPAAIGQKMLQTAGEPKGMKKAA